MLNKNKSYKINKQSILIFGVTGQDGSLLAKEYLDKGYAIHGVITSKKFSPRNLDKLNIRDEIILYHFKNFNKSAVEFLIKKSQCSKIFILSGISSVKKSEKKKYETITSNNLVLIEIMEFLRLKNIKKIKIFNATSGEIFGDNSRPNNENSKLNPLSFYALAKSISLEISRSYREQFNLKIYNGILFNHESYLRPKTYVIKKIISSAKKITRKKLNHLTLGNTSVYRDWGWAPEYVKIIFKIMDKNKADDFIIATGKITKLEDIVDKVFKLFKLNKKKHLKKSKNFKRTLEPLKIIADISKLKSNIQSVPAIRIDEIIKFMIIREN